MILLKIIIIIRFRDIRVLLKQSNLLEDITPSPNLKNVLQYILVIVLFANKIKCLDTRYINILNLSTY